MDREIALMKRYQKDANIIAYVHCNTIVLIKREISEDSKTRIFEIIVNLESEKPISKRAVELSEMDPLDFDEVKRRITEQTISDFNEDWRISHKDVDLEKLENTEFVSLPSVEEEYLEEEAEAARAEREKTDPLARTLENAMKILDTVLNEKQKRWYLMAHLDELSDREIARREGCAHTTVSRGMAVIEKKIKKFFEAPQKYAPNRSKKL